MNFDEEISRSLKELFSSRSEPENTEVVKMTMEEKRQYLREKLDLLNTVHTFEVGDIVQYKPGLKNKKGDGPFIVTELLESPTFDKESPSGNCYFMEPLDIKLGEINDGDFVEYHYDSRRFEPVEKS